MPSLLGLCISTEKTRQRMLGSAWSWPTGIHDLQLLCANAGRYVVGLSSSDFFHSTLFVTQTLLRISAGWAPVQQKGAKSGKYFRSCSDKQNDRVHPNASAICCSNPPNGPDSRSNDYGPSKLKLYQWSTVHPEYWTVQPHSGSSGLLVRVLMEDI